MKILHLPELTRNINWRKYTIGFGMVGFALLLIFGNFRSRNYYETLKAAKKEMLQNDSQSRPSRSIQSFTETELECISEKCAVTCHGNMTHLNNYLSRESCTLIILHISKGIFPEDELQSNWLEGSFYLKSIQISSSKLIGIHNGTFNQPGVAYVQELELYDVEISTLNENTFLGLKDIESFTLVNKVDHFSGNAFLKPMMGTLKKLVIKDGSNTAIDPGPWLHGESFPQLQSIVFDGSNFGEYINADTFNHLKQLSTLKLNSCNISRIADGSFDFVMNQTAILVSLQDNQLKRLAGEYLSTINFQRRFNLHNNPWDCTCKLEHLSRVFKNCPECFGENSKCSTPPQLAGKLLDQVNLNRCEDETPIPLETTTLKSSSTTSSPQVTTLSANSIIIECAKHELPSTNYPSSSIELSPPDGHFKITPISETSVRLVFEDPSDDLAVIWFKEQTSLDEYGASIGLIGDLGVACQNELHVSLLVEELIVNQSYTFCLIKNGTQLVSPFNCKSYFSVVNGNDGGNDITWLRTKDKPMAIGIFVGSIVVSIFLGMIGMFFLIRYNPWLLRSSKQIEVEDSGYYQMNTKNPLKEPSVENSYSLKAPTAPIRRFSSDSGLSYMMANNYEELEFYRRTNVSLVFPNRVPKSPAPPLPKRTNNIEEMKIQTLEKKDVIYEKDNDDGYTSVV